MSISQDYFITDCCYWLRLFSPQTGRTPQKVQGISLPSVKHSCLFNFPLLKRQNSRSSYSLGWSLPRESLGMCHTEEVSLATGMWGKTHGNICSLPPSLGLLSTAVCQALKTTLVLAVNSFSH